MFTGLIEEIGEVRSVSRTGDSIRFSVQAGSILEDLVIGDSVAVSGICLTVVELGPSHFTVDATPETLSRTTLENLERGRRVNLERALTLSKPLGGHLVQGHVDGLGTLASIRKEGNSTILTIEAEPELLLAMVKKGSVTVDGASLTVSALTDLSFSISVIPHTLERTTLRERRVGDRVNIEVDIIGKYVHRFLAGVQDTPEAAGDEELLRKLSEGGFL